MQFTKVTWYSKLIALGLFVALPFTGFYLGAKYEESISPSEKIFVDTFERARQEQETESEVVETDDLTLNLNRSTSDLTYQGQVRLPSPCHKLNQETKIYNSTIQIYFEVEKPDSGTFCSQTITPRKVSGSIDAGENSSISIFFNGKKVN